MPKTANVVTVKAADLPEVAAELARLAAARAVIAENADAINAARTSLPNPHPIRAALVALVDAIEGEAGYELRKVEQ